MTEKAVELQKRKGSGNRIVVLTCYDYPTALIEEEAGVDVVFVGDSLGTNVLGYEHEQQVTMGDMVHHLKAVRRGVSAAYLLVDMPYQSYETTETALENALKFVSWGAEGVKLEGFEPRVVEALTKQGLDIWCHLGLNPQLHARKRLQADSADRAIELVEQSETLEAAGAAFLVLEMVPAEVAGAVTERLRIPTIGIGAGPHTDGQVLVIPDLLGVTTVKLKHARPYDDFHCRGVEAISSFVDDVKKGNFPGSANYWNLPEAEREGFAARYVSMAK